MRQINPNIWPDGGYVFHERDGSTHRDESWRKLEARVVAYRERNHFDPGNVWEEIMTQACGAAPGLCGEYSGDTVPQPTGTGVNFTQRIIEWLAWAVGQKRIARWQRVNNEVAGQRAAICAVCPKQQGLNTTCGACIASIGTARKALLDGEEPGYVSLHPCGVLQEDTVSTIYAKLPPSNNPELPANCWRRV